MIEEQDPNNEHVDPGSWLSKSDEAFLSKASAILSPDQLEIAKATIADHNHSANILYQYNKNRIPMMIVP